MLRPLALATPLRDLAAQHDLGGLSAYVLCRHRFIDEHLLRALDDGVEQVLILGAGYDSRAYRFADRAGRPSGVRGRPAAAVAAQGRDRRGASDRVRVGLDPRVEIDFRTQSLTERLDTAGFARGKRTFVVWEGVVPYLDSAAVDATLAALAACAAPARRSRWICGTARADPARWHRCGGSVRRPSR